MRVLITGSNGLLGQNLLFVLQKDPDFEIAATSRSQNVYPNLDKISFIQADLADEKQVAEIEKVFHPDIIVHCAAMTQVDPCETDQTSAWQANVEASRMVCNMAVRCESKLIYVSTDFVFDGESGPYAETDLPSPVNYYGITKKISEEGVMALEGYVPWAIVRTILVYGVTPAMSRSNLVLWVKESLEAGKKIRVVNDQFRMPTLVNDLAEGILQIIKRHKTGIYHLSGPKLQSVYDLATETAQFFGLDEKLITPISSESLHQPGKRPPSTGFILDKAIKELDYQPKTFREGLAVVQNLIVNL